MCSTRCGKKFEIILKRPKFKIFHAPVGALCRHLYFVTPKKGEKHAFCIKLCHNVAKGDA